MTGPVQCNDIGAAPLSSHAPLFGLDNGSIYVHEYYVVHFGMTIFKTEPRKMSTTTPKLEERDILEAKLVAIREAIRAHEGIENIDELASNQFFAAHYKVLIALRRADSRLKAQVAKLGPRKKDQ